MASKFRQPARVSRMLPFGGPSVWLEFSPLAQLTGAINLGQGAPGWSPPPFLTSSLSAASQNPAYSQYARSAGLPALTQEISRVYSPRVVPPALAPRRLDPLAEVLVTVGASQALYLVGQALLNPGDEAVLIAPAFDIYSGAVSLAGGTPRYVPLRVRPGCTEIRSSADLAIDIDELRENLSERTKLLFLNSPHNPTGKVFSRTEYEAILSAVEALAPHCVVVSDEVYERLVYDGAHVPFASVSEAAFARTLSVYSAGKTFSATGIKLGWVVGPAGLLHDLKLAHQYMVFATNHPAQAAVAEALQVAEEQYEGCETYYEWVCEEYRRKREAMVEAVVRGGMQAIRPEGAFYVCAIVPSGHRARGAGGLPEEVKGFLRDGRVQVDEGTVEREDYNVCRVLTARFGVAAIPNSAFFPQEMVGRTALATDCVRFAFCKEDRELEEAAEKLRKVAG